MIQGTMTTASYEQVPTSEDAVDDRYDKDSIGDESDDERRDESDDDDGYMDSEEETSEESSVASKGESWQEAVVWSEWRQHAVAVLIAILATILAMSLQNATSRTATHRQQENKAAYTNIYPHAHLEHYRRTGDISFCGHLLQQPPSKHLAIMDFDVPKELVRSLQYHYEADSAEDDYYEVVLEQETPSAAVNDPEYHCLRELVRQSSDKQTIVKGMTYYYEPPSYADMYPDLDEGISVSKQRKSKSQNAPQPAHLTFTGFGAKFVNLASFPVLLYWDGKGGHEKSAKLVGEIAPFDSLGTATTPGQSFSVTPVYDSSHALDRWVLTSDEPIVVYIPDKKEELTPKQQILYDMQMLNQHFARDYLIASQRPWLAHFPRPRPMHPMHAADFVGQQHVIPASLDEHGEPVTTPSKMQLEVLSVTPRVFTIENFLSDEECEHLMQAAHDQGLKGSILYSGGKPQRQHDLSTRSSKNAWVGRETSTVTDEIYRRAARVLRMDHSLLQQPPVVDEEAAHHSDARVHSIAESLQVVRYKVGEEYTAHHDFVYPSQTHRYQPTRYATLLMYLNDDFEGGETNFPRAVNPRYQEGVTITPKKGMGVLFYNMLPDGNVDDLSQHQSNPVKTGEKWLANLWIWDPVIN